MKKYDAKVMMEKENFEAVNAFLINKYTTFQRKEVQGVLIKKLSAADLILKNKPKDKGGKTTHIAFTTHSRYFFSDFIASEYLNHSNVFHKEMRLPLKVQNRYDRNVQLPREFTDSFTYIWVNAKDGENQNQIGMSKTDMDDEKFRNVREDIQLGDFVLFVKTFDKEKTVFQKELYLIVVKPTDNELWDILSKFYRGHNIRVYEEQSTNFILDFDENASEVNEDTAAYEFNSELEGSNIIYYGVPGTGKSHLVDDTFEENVYRTTFHEEYSYSDFVGQVAPVLKKLRVERGGEITVEEKLIYEFVPGDFAKVLKKSIDSPGVMHHFVIEELNRANSAAVFGDVFQLLDRENGISKYSINNEQLARYVYRNAKHIDVIEEHLKLKISRYEIKIPNNLNILSTMNTSDQNIYPLDTAFTRRWDMQYIPIEFSKIRNDLLIDGLNIPWKDFAEYVNRLILDMRVINSEDKQLGPFFATKDTISNKGKFANKVLVYLWKDVFKHNAGELFNTENVRGIQSLITTFINNPTDVFNEEFLTELIPVVKTENQAGEEDEKV